MQISALGEGNQAFGHRAQTLCLRQRGRNLTMRKQARCHVGEHQPLMGWA
jgi:hypothetical protein